MRAHTLIPTHCVLQALQLARNQNDSIKEEVHREMALTKFWLWERRSRDKHSRQAAFQQRLQQMMQQAHDAEMQEHLGGATQRPVSLTPQ